MPISGCHDLPSRNNLQNKPNSAATLWRHACLTTPEHVKESPNPPNPSCCRSRGGMRGWPLPRPTHAPATYARTTGTRHTREKTRTPHAAAPAAACVPGRSTGQHMLPQQPSKQTATAPLPPQNNPSCRHSVAACVSDHSRGQDFAPATALRTNDNTPPTKPKNKKRINPQRQKYHRHSGIFIPRKRKENVRNLRRKAGHPTGVAAALSRSDSTGGERRRGNLFLSSDNPPPSPPQIRAQNPKKKPI